MPSKLDTLVPDIYKVLDKLSDGIDITPDIEPELDALVEDIREAVLHWAVPQDNSGSLRMSNVGRPDRLLWFDAKSPKEPERMPPYAHLKFLYGHILEQLVLFLVRVSGHEIQAEQETVEVDGIKGHMDAVIDGEVVDVKTTSPFGFKKFKEGTLAEDDPFGYLAQLAGYEASQGTEEGGFLVINKVDGELCLFRPDDLDKPNINIRINRVKEVVQLDTPPDLCYNDVPEGKSGNMVINKSCTFCNHKHECRKDANDGEGLIMFRYHNGIKYFTHIERMPKVERVN